jgi:DNA-binding transcriptional ArsR family regulator
MSLRKPKIDVNRVFHALADATRREILERVSRGPVSVSQLADPLHISLAAVVQHLQVMEDSGLIHSEKVGRVRTCRMEPAGRTVAARARCALWERRSERLGEGLAGSGEE